MCIFFILTYAVDKITVSIGSSSDISYSHYGSIMYMIKIIITANKYPCWDMSRQIFNCFFLSAGSYLKLVIEVMANLHNAPLLERT